MNWFGYVWIVALALAYLLWTIKCVRDFIDDVRGVDTYKLKENSTCTEQP